MFLVCVVFVVPNAPHEQDRTAEAQMFQRMHHRRWGGRAAERCLDATTSSVVCVGVGVCVPKCNTSSALAGQPNGAWMLLAVLGGGRRASPRTPPPRTPFSVRWQGPDKVCVGRTPTSVRCKKYMKKVCSGFFKRHYWTCGSQS